MRRACSGQRRRRTAWHCHAPAAAACGARLPLPCHPLSSCSPPARSLARPAAASAEVGQLLAGKPRFRKLEFTAGEPPLGCCAPCLGSRSLRSKEQMPCSGAGNAVLLAPLGAVRRPRCLRTPPLFAQHPLQQAHTCGVAYCPSSCLPPTLPKSCESQTCWQTSETFLSCGGGTRRSRSKPWSERTERRSHCFDGAGCRDGASEGGSRLLPIPRLLPLSLSLFLLPIPVLLPAPCAPYLTLLLPVLPFVSPTLLPPGLHC